MQKTMFPPNQHGARLFPVLSIVLVVMYVNQTWLFWSNKKQTQQIANRANNVAVTLPHSSVEFCQTLNQLKTIANLHPSNNGGGYNSTNRILRNGGWRAIECGLRSRNVQAITAAADLSIQLTLQRATAKKFAQDAVLSTLIVHALANSVDAKLYNNASGPGTSEPTPLLPLLQLLSQIIPHYPFGLNAERDEKLRTAINLLSQETVSRLTSRKYKNDYVMQCKTLLLHTASQADSYLQRTLAKQYVYDPIISHFASLLPMHGKVDRTDRMFGVFTESDEIYLLLAFVDKLWGNSKAYTNDRLQWVFSFVRSMFQFSVEHCDLLASLMLALGLGFFWGGLRCAVALRSVPLPMHFVHWSRWSWVAFMAHIHARRASLASMLVTLHTFAPDQHRTWLQSDLGQTIWLGVRTSGEIAMLRLLLLFCPYFILPCAVTALVASTVVGKT